MVDTRCSWYPVLNKMQNDVKTEEYKMEDMLRAQRDRRYIKIEDIYIVYLTGRPLHLCYKASAMDKQPKRI